MFGVISRWVLLPSGRLAAVSIFPVMMNKISLKNNNNTQFHWTVVNKLNKHWTWRTVNDATVTNVLTLMSLTVFIKQNSKYIYLFSTLSQTDTLSVVQVHPPSSSNCVVFLWAVSFYASHRVSFSALVVWNFPCFFALNSPRQCWQEPPAPEDSCHKTLPRELPWFVSPVRC